MGRTPDSKRVVDEHRSVADEAILADGDEFADECVTLHAGSWADADPFLNLNEGADEGAVSQCASIEIDRFDHGDVVAEFDIDDAALVDSRLAHGMHEVESLA